MIYFFYGDSKKAGDKAKTLVDSLLKKKPDASLFVVDEENCNKETFQEMTQSSALFENRYVVRLKQVLEKETVLNFLKEMKNSENIFVWSEGEIKKTDLKKIEKHTEKIIEVSGVIKKEKRSNEVFSICDPIINRDKQKTWIKFQELLNNYPVAELHGIIFMQFKNIAITFKASQKDSGLAPFSYGQAKKAQNKYSEKEVLVKCSELTKIIHESRLSGLDLSTALEKFILEI